MTDYFDDGKNMCISNLMVPVKAKFIGGDELILTLNGKLECSEGAVLRVSVKNNDMYTREYYVPLKERAIFSVVIDYDDTSIVFNIIGTCSSPNLSVCQLSRTRKPVDTLLAVKSLFTYPKSTTFSDLKEMTTRDDSFILAIEDGDEFSVHIGEDRYYSVRTRNFSVVYVNRKIDYMYSGYKVIGADNKKILFINIGQTQLFDVDYLMCNFDFIYKHYLK